MNDEQSALVLIFNQRNELALQLRAATIDEYPLHWDSSAGGDIEPGEDSKTAAIRETREELGIAVSVIFVGEYNYSDAAHQDRLFLYRARHEGPFAPDPIEVSEVRFFAYEEIKKMIAAGANFHPEFVFIWSLGTISQIWSDVPSSAHTLSGY